MFDFYMFANFTRFESVLLDYWWYTLCSLKYSEPLDSKISIQCGLHFGLVENFEDNFMLM